MIRLYISDTDPAVHGYVAGCPSSVDDDNIFGWEAHCRAVCLSGFPSWPCDDVGASCGEGKNNAMRNCLCPHVDSLTTAGWLLLRLPNPWWPLTHPNVWDSVRFWESLDRDCLGQAAGAKGQRQKSSSDNNYGNQYVRRREKTTDTYMLEYALQIKADVCTYIIRPMSRSQLTFWTEHMHMVIWNL